MWMLLFLILLGGLLFAFAEMQKVIWRSGHTVGLKVAGAFGVTIGLLLAVQFALAFVYGLQGALNGRYG